MQIFKNCPNCCSRDFRFENSVRFECNDCHFIYFHNTAAAVAGILHYNGNILFTVRNQEPQKGTWDLPGGFISPNESATFALRREIHEELGFFIQEQQCEYLTTFPNQYEYKGVIYNTLDIFYVIHLEVFPEVLLAEDEIQNVLWVKKEDVKLQNIGLQSIKKVVEQYVTKSQLLKIS